MKKYFIDAFLWYVMLSFIMAVFWMLTGLTGYIPVRILLALILAYFKPLKKIEWPRF